MYAPTILLTAAAALLAPAAGAAIDTKVLLPRANSGQATFYGGNLAGGNCMFTTLPGLPAGVYGTASANWDKAAHCGRCVSVKGPRGNSITAMIVDQCPGCGLNHLDLFPDAFKALAEPSKGVIPISWSYVRCPVSGPLQLHAKSGASQYWFSMQVVNSAKGIQKLEVSGGSGQGGGWIQTARQDYNYFQLSTGGGTGSGTVNVRLTSTDGDVLVVNGVSVASDATTTAAKNF